MAKVFLTNINLKGNQLLNAAIQPASSAPSALSAGQLYYNTVDSLFYYSTGTGTGNWEPVGVQFITSVGDNLSVTDGVLNLGNKVVITDATQTLTNKTIDNAKVTGTTSFRDGSDTEYVRIERSYTGTTRIISTDDLSLRSNDGDIILYPGNDNGGPGRAYVHWGNDATGAFPEHEITTAGNSQTLTNKVIGDTLYFHDSVTTGYEGEILINPGNNDFQVTANVADLHLKSTTGQVLVETDSISGGPVVLNGATGNYLFSNNTEDNLIATQGWVYTNSSNYISAVDGNIFNVDSGTLQLNTSVNHVNGEIHLKKNEYWVNGDTAGTQYGIIAANPISDEFSIASVNYPLHIESHVGDITLSPDSDVVNIGSGYGELHLQKTEYWRGGTQQGIIAAQSDGSLRITGNNSGLQLETNSGDINLNADGNVHVNNSDLYVNNSGRIYVSNGMYIGGQDFSNNGFLNIRDYNGENLFSVNTDGNLNGGTATVTVKGDINVYGPGAFGNQVANISRDNDDNLIINATQNNLILQSDNSNSVYIGSVAADNKVATIGDLTAVQSGLTWKEAVNLLWDNAVTNTGASGTFVIDGHPALTSANNGYRILALGAGTDSGIYVYNDDDTNWILTRAIDADTDAELKGAAVFVEEGTIYGATAWVQQNHYITSFADQNWVQFSGQGTYVAGDGINIDGQEISVQLDSDSLSKSPSGLKVHLATDGGLNNDGGLYVVTGTGLVLSSNHVQLDTSNGYGVRKFVDEIAGDNSNDSFTITHNFGTRDVTVQIYQTSGTPDTQFQDVEADIVRTSTSAITVSFASAPATGTTYNVVVVG